MDAKEAFSCELRKVARDWCTRFDGELKAFDLTTSRALALRYLSRAKGPMTQSELACELGIEHPTCVRLIDGLESQGLVVRRAVGGDRRANHLCLTRAGRLLGGRVEALTKRLRARYLRGVRPEELRIATQVLAVIAGNLQKAEAAA